MTKGGCEWEITRKSVAFEMTHPGLYARAKARRLVRQAGEPGDVEWWWRVAVPWFGRLMTAVVDEGYATLKGISRPMPPTLRRSIEGSIELGRPTPDLEAYLTLWWMGGGT